MSATETRSLFEILAEIVEALEPLVDEVPGLQLTPGMNVNPTPPAIDVYPGAPFQTPGSFGLTGDQIFLSIRARVSTADLASGQRLLLQLLDPTDERSVGALLARSSVTVLEVSEYREYPGNSPGKRLLGAEWRTSTFL